jgi:hypothetical protein
MASLLHRQLQQVLRLLELRPQLVLGLLQGLGQ